MQQADVEASDKQDIKSLHESIQLLWDKARLMSELLLQLKSENKELKNKVASLEECERNLNNELRKREQELQESLTNLAEIKNNGNSIFTKEELEGYKSRLKELIMKINSRL